MIELSNLEEMFENIQAETDWDMHKPMLWGYFFTDPSREKLQEAATVLENLGYRFVDLYIPDLDEGEDEYFFLHMEKEEIHSPQTLNERNIQLYAFADKHGLDSYEWMLGPFSPENSVERDRSTAMLLGSLRNFAAPAAPHLQR